MDPPLLTTKLQIPRLRPERLARPRLLERLDAGLSRPLTLVSAPAGFGKTTLVAEWLAESRRPSSWLSLDEQDNDAIRFLTHLCAALRQIEDEAGQATLATLAVAGPQSSLPGLMPQLTNEISAIPEEFILVLDDYHLVTAQAIHDALAFLVDHPPQPLHLVIVSRSDPPLPLARLRARGQVNEIRQADLRFAPEETEHLLCRSLGLPLSPEQSHALTERTEGWIAGLQMAALALQELLAQPGQVRDRADAFVRAFGGTHRHVLDYLVEEVLNRQPPHVRTFLLQTSILERMCAPLCEAVLRQRGTAISPEGSLSNHPDPTSRLSGQQMLEELERANLFIAPLDDHREWFRYHRLFADLLRQRLQSGVLPGIDIPALHRRAADWFEAQGMPAEAVRHALAASDFEKVAGMIERAAPIVWRHGELTTLLQWMESLPEDALRAHPLLCVYAAAVLVIRSTSLARAQALAQAAEENDPDGRVCGEVAVLRALLALYQGQIPSGMRFARDALLRLPEASVFRGLATRALSALHLMAWELGAAERLLEEDVTLSDAAGDRLGASASLRRLGSLAFYRGELRKARALYERALEKSRDANGRLWPVAGRILAHLGELALESNELEAAERLLGEAVELLEGLAPGWNTGSYLALAQLRQAVGDEAGARQAFHRAEELARGTDTQMDDAYLGLQEARLAIAQRNLEIAERWASRWTALARKHPRPPGPDVDGFLRSRLFREMGQTTLARLHLAQGRPDQALLALEPLLRNAGDHTSSGNQIELRALRALAESAQGRDEAALADLGRALELAEPEGFARTFIDGGEPMARLLQQAIWRGVVAGYAARLLKALKGSSRPPSMSAAGPLTLAGGRAALVEPLTERELEVLRLLRTSLTTPEIAAELGIAPSTVRTFVKSLYGKLGVHHRLEAIDKAIDLGILKA